MSTLNFFIPSDVEIRHALLIGKIRRSDRSVVVFVTDLVEDPDDRNVIGSMRIEPVEHPAYRDHGNGDVISSEMGAWIDVVLKQDGSVSRVNIDGDANQVHCLNAIRYNRKDLVSSQFLVGPAADDDAGEFAVLARLLQEGDSVNFPRSFRKAEESESVSSSCVRMSAMKAKSFITSASCFCEVIEEKINHVCLCSKYFFGRSPPSALTAWNVIFILVCDFLLGSFVARYFISHSIPSDIMHYFKAVVDVLIPSLERLLTWIMGVPAGLKLNVELNSALGNFFMYHIYLWKTYMIIIQPFAYVLLDCVVFLGQFGLSIQICILRDLVALAAFHVYCFYVYAARLFNLKKSALSSLWRLFRGKKWNPLRRRVDSADYDVDQLFVGTLVFTILLFLLPTVLVYYVVFTALRLLFLLFDGILARVVNLLNTFPLFSMTFWLIDSPMIRCEYDVTLPDAPGLYLRIGSMIDAAYEVPAHELELRTVRGSLLCTLRKSVVPSVYGNFSVDLRYAWHCLTTGKIVYPL